MNMNIIIPADKRPLLETLSQRIDTHYLDCAVTVLIDKTERTITFVSGQSPLCTQCCLVVDENSTTLRDKQFSIDGSFAKQLIHYFVKGQDIELDFQTQNSATMLVELVDTTSLSKDQFQTAALRRCLCQDALEEHITHVTISPNSPTTIASKTTIERIIYEARDNLPFEFIELNKEEQYMRIQRQGIVEDKSLPYDIKLPISVVLTPETTEQMTELCRITSSKEIEIIQQGETITFKTPECSLTSSLAGVEEFYQKEPNPTRVIKYVALNLFAFKKELEHCFRYYSRIKKANDAFLYLGDSEAAIAVLTEPYEFVHPIHVFEVGESEANSGSLFRFSPRDLENIRIKNSLEAQKTRLNIFENVHGELSLGVYYSLEATLPYDTIAIEKDERHLKKVLKLLESVEEKQGEITKNPPERQGDLFSFGDENYD